MSDVMIEAKGLTKRYGPHRALDGASFSIRQGEVVGFLGPNGAGKSTTMKILTCFIAPSEGTAQVNGRDIWQDPIGVRASIGYLPESTPLYTEMLVAEYLEFMGQMRGLRGAVLAQRIKKVVEETSLGDVYAKEIRALSKGFRQRVGLAQALIHEPPILILDEPLSGLDPNQMTDIRDLIRNIGRSRTIIFSTHNLHEIGLSCTRVMVISSGKIVFDSTPDALTTKKPLRGFAVTLGPAPDRAAAMARATEAFRKIPGVSSVDSTGTDTLEVLVTNGANVRAELASAASGLGLLVVELAALRPDLHDIFRELTLGSANAAASAGRALSRASAAAAAAADDEDDEDAAASDDEEDE